MWCNRVLECEPLDSGGVVVAGSNPAVPTNSYPCKAKVVKPKSFAMQLFKGGRSAELRGQYVLSLSL